MQNKRYGIIGIGHCCQDSICTIESYPPEDGSTHILSIDDTQGGGAVATAMVAAARLGVKTAIIANLGDDETGGKIQSGFESYGVDTECIQLIPGGRSSSSVVMVDPAHGSRTKFPFRDNLPPIDFTPQKQEAISQSSILHLDGTNYGNALAAARIARENGVTISLDGCSRQKENALNLQLAEMADILITNAVYPQAVTGCETREEALMQLAGLGHKKAVMTTLGSEGVMAVIDGCIVRFPAFCVAAVDTTGAGDVFHGAFLTAWLEGRRTEECIRFAAAVAALKCQKPGGRSGIPTRAETEAFLARYS